MEPSSFTNVKEALISSAEALLIDHSSTKTEEDVISNKIHQNNSKREELEQKANSISEKIKGLKLMLDETWKEITSVQYGTAVHLASLQKCSESIEVQLKEVERADLEYTSLKTRVEELSAQYVELGAQFQAEEKRKAELARQLKAAVQAKNSAEKQVECATQKLGEVEKSISESNGKLLEMQSELKQEEQNLENVVGLLKTVEERLTVIKNDIVHANERIEAKNLQIQGLQATLETAKDDKHNTQRTFEVRLRSCYDEVLEQMAKDVEAQCVTIEEAKLKIQSTIDENKRMQEANNSNKEIITQMRGQQEKTTKEHEAIQKQVSSLKFEAEELRKYKSSLEDELKSIKKSVESSRTELEKRKSIHEANIRNVSTIAEERQRELHERKTKINELSSKLTDIQHYLSSLVDCKTSLETEMEQLFSSKQVIDAEVHRYSHSNDELICKIEKQKEELQALALSNRESQNLARRIEEQIKARQEIKEKKAVYEEEKRKLSKELESKKEEIEKHEKSLLNDKLVLLKEERARFDEESSARNKKIVVDYERERNRKSDVIQNLNDSIVSLKTKPASPITPIKKKKKSIAEQADVLDDLSMKPKSSSAKKMTSLTQEDHTAKTSTDVKTPSPKKQKGEKKRKDHNAEESTGRKKPKESPKISKTPSTAKKKSTPASSSKLNNSQLSIFDFNE